MNAIVQTLNAAGRAFVGAAVPMLIQSSLLILILLGVDALLRKRVRAVFRYWIWMLVLVKLVLPPSLWSPVSLGTWFGEKLEVPTTALLEAPELPPIEPSPAELSPAVTSILSQPPRMLVDPPRPEPMVPQAPAPAETVAQPAPIDRLPALGFLSWQGLALLVWAATVAALLLLLVQRTFFVRGLVAQGQEAGGVLVRELDRCRQRLGLRRPIALRLSPNAASPAVCGLWRPVILVPQNLAARLRGTDLDAVLFHELAHVRRGDLWINLAQTILQILYFYNPLLWLANALIRRIREQAVDETVLVALGESAPQYPDTLIHVAKLALARRPALSLRLIGVVESKSALTSRIKHILNRPLPKTAKLGLLGLLAIIVIAVVLLPMAKGDGFGRQGSNVLIRFMPEDDGLSRTIGDMRRYARNYTVSFKRGETLAIVAELYQTGQPMRVLGCRTFTDPGRPERLSATLTMRDLNNERTAIEHSLEITLGKESLRATGVRVNTPEFFNNWDGGFLPVSEIAEKRRDGQTYVEFTELLSLRVCPNGGQPPAPRIWMPGHNVSWGDSDAYFVLVKMLPLSQLDILQVDRPLSGVRLPDGSPLRTQLPDGTYLPDNASKEQGEAVVEEYLLNLKRLMMQERMPLPKLMTHRYHKEGDPIWVTLSYPNGRTWKPDLEELVRRAIRETTGTFIFLVDGEEYESSWLCGPFAGGGEGRGELPEYLKRSTGFHLRPGKHTVAYGWKDLNVVDPNDPNHPVHFTRLATDPVEFEVVEELPVDYYRPVYQDGWEDILRRSIETHFTDDWHKHGVFGRLLSLRVNKLPFDTAFAVYVQAEGQEEQYPAGEMALSAGSYPRVVACDHGVKELNWDTAGDKRWRIILRPSIQVAKKYPPIREFYAREFVTDWLTFERSPEFELNRLIEMSQRGGPHRYGDTIRADKPVDLDRLPRRRGKRGPAWPLPAGFELGWSPDHGGTLRIDPNSGVRLLWLPEADARLVNVTAESRRRLVELPQSRTTEITPPQGERTLAAVLSSEGKVYFVTVSKVNEAWANLDWFEDQEATKQLAGGEPAAATTAPPAGAPSVQPARDASLDSDGDGLSDYDEIHKYLTDPAKKDSDGDGIPDGDWNERREYTYSVRTVLRYMPPFHEEGLNDDFQDGRVLKQTNEYIEIEVIHYPFGDELG
jgi:beta-lactamase regulating signal transducer with metallopeptidase domain